MADWEREYEDIKRRIVRKRQSGHSFNRGEHEALTASIRRLETQTADMAANPMSYGVSEGEVARRRTLVDNLGKQLALAQQGPSSAVQGFGRATKEEMVQDTKQIMQLQDTIVDDIGAGADRLLQQANMMNDEVQKSTRLLEDFDEDVDKAHEGLREEAGHAERIRETTGTMWLYVTIAVLIVILIVLLIFGLS